MAILAPDIKQYYEDLAEMFSTDGWKKLIEEAKSEIYQIQADALDAHDWETVCRLRGKAEQLAYLVRLEEVSDLQRKSLEEEAEDADV